MRWDQIRDLSDPREQINSTVCLKITNGAILTCFIDLGLLEALILTLLVAMKRPKDYLHFTRADHCLNLSSSAQGAETPSGSDWLRCVSITENRGQSIVDLVCGPGARRDGSAFFYPPNKSAHFHTNVISQHTLMYVLSSDVAKADLQIKRDTVFLL